MGSYLSLTSRLSLMFSITMLAIWGLVSVVLMQALEHHFARQDETDIQGKIILAKNFLTTHLQGTDQTWSLLEAHLNDALSGHGGHYLLIQDEQGRILANAKPEHRQQPGMTRAVPAAESLPLQESWTEEGIRYRSITEQIFLDPSLPWADAPQSVLVRVALDTSYHQHFIDEIKTGLAWLTGAIALVSVLLGWFASRTGLKPLRTLASLSARVTANKLDHRLPLANAPAELHAPIQAFNDMLERLEDSFQRLTAFSSDIAHELRTPVNSLMMQTQVALAHPRNAEEYREVLYANLETAERLARMIGEMLFLAKSEQGQLSMQPEPLALADELDELLEFFEPLASEQQVRLNRRGNGHLLGDKSMLQRAFSNLLTNAIRYTPPQGEVRIAVSSNHEGTTVEVSNPGPAIPPEQWPRLFDRFYRADSARQPVTEGTGLGLAIAKAIITAHGGTLSVHSDERETCFRAHFSGDGPPVATK
ncbi:heavy metal sensor histidine kinase [Oceanisphaera psychrotolerans]|uniref:Sensor protein n=1 Tax=Oceanisphaera psychrotolerans TaxID=1414654 RepID=A0A1J4Q9G0_9GAMM|nr:heavy metal sensor histidine kinase [Oceanisphaera psychrotolerans]OIN04472.1 two-component sensor histidine kinase [Oceanisphaera psychrotolerans]